MTVMMVNIVLPYSDYKNHFLKKSYFALLLFTFLNKTIEIGKKWMFPRCSLTFKSLYSPPATVAAVLGEEHIVKIAILFDEITAC